MPAATAASASAAAGAADRQQHDPRAGRRRAPDVFVQRRRAVAELEHLAEHGDAPRRAAPASTSSARRVAVGFAL